MVKAGLAYIVGREDKLVPVLSGLQLKVWEALCNWDKPYGPSYDDLKQLAGIKSKSTVHKAVKLLEQARLITVDHEAKGGAWGTLRLSVVVE